jgi:hypothetical protein
VIEDWLERLKDRIMQQCVVVALVRTAVPARVLQTSEQEGMVVRIEASTRERGRGWVGKTV